MIGINKLIEDVINLAEKSDNFYEVEVSVLVRRDGGLRSEFFRAQAQCPLESDNNSDTATKNPFQWM
jgi:hypothetical protein